ncbi:MAG: alginate export family protein [Cyanobacteriota bacterium]|nr:alginate export family protein [Cyanobacteriota bacterium]
MRSLACCAVVALNAAVKAEDSQTAPFPTPSLDPAPLPIAETSPGTTPPGGFLLSPGLLNAIRITSIKIYLENPTPDSQYNKDLRAQIGQAFAVRAGDNFSELFFDAGLRRVQQLPFVAAARYNLYQVQVAGEAVAVLIVRLKPEVASPPAETGMLLSGRWSDFPNLYTNQRSTVVGVFRSGLANFTSGNSWFGRADIFTQGNPLATNPAGKGAYDWIDAYGELGVAGITQLGRIPFYVYGSVTDMLSATVQPDLFQSNDRSFNQIEDLYGGVVYGYRNDQSRFAVNLSGGRQDYRISNGMLFANGASNGSDRGAILLNPRTAFEGTAIGRLRWNDLLLEAFYLNPNELVILNTNTTFAGLNLEYNDNRSLQLGFSYITVPQSDFSYFTSTDVYSRQGLNVVYPRLLWRNPLGLNGLWLQAEYAYEWNRHFDMSAQAGWAQIGTTFQALPWTPSLSYRYALFSGDQPSSKAFERFDPLLSGGGPETWIQGSSLVKIYQNSNLTSQQVIFRLVPDPRFDLSFQYINLMADDLNNLGGTQALSFLQTKEIGQELTLTARYNLTRNVLLYGSGSVALPGTAIQRVTNGNPGPWYFLQLSLFVSF